ncbi:hypothetical protein MOX02_59180 [Methylobacterium oxalidis]|uniref:Uncharacterized protein n=1 Tax=Methylobacterium oxalidis TaxID=944322 RepID=A0A512JD34_9HYPH|nr:hypothetical protein MOX02_59180 [Methylobacterium oxalidis]GJE32900.1 hypothetical protein LDDCCGHA_3096 [Methylobacterium oxalidis]GLS66331.1 hypothetical protein GCM10007888_47130 [Methylobacterium oxalidis]
MRNSFALWRVQHTVTALQDLNFEQLTPEQQRGASWLMRAGWGKLRKRTRLAVTRSFRLPDSLSFALLC